jgi:hypothetical protein
MIKPEAVSTAVAPVRPVTEADGVRVQVSEAVDPSGGHDALIGIPGLELSLYVIDTRLSGVQVAD